MFESIRRFQLLFQKLELVVSTDRRSLCIYFFWRISFFHYSFLPNIHGSFVLFILFFEDFVYKHCIYIFFYSLLPSFQLLTCHSIPSQYQNCIFFNYYYTCTQMHLWMQSGFITGCSCVLLALFVFKCP